MARPREPGRLQKVTLNLWHGDFELLRKLHGTEGAGKVIRKMVRDRLKELKSSIRSHNFEDHPDV